MNFKKHYRRRTKTKAIVSSAVKNFYELLKYVSLQLRV